MGERDTETGADGESGRGKKQRQRVRARERNVEGTRLMPRGRSERGRMMEINGEWQLGD